MKNKTATPVLVTGGAGYIGSHTCKALAAAGYHPVTLDNLTLGHRWAVKWGPLIEADLLDAEAVLRALHAHDIKAVVHFAASAYVGDSMRDPAGPALLFGHGGGPDDGPGAPLPRPRRQP